MSKFKYQDQRTKFWEFKKHFATAKRDYPRFFREIAMMLDIQDDIIGGFARAKVSDRRIDANWRDVRCYKALLERIKAKLVNVNKRIKHADAQTSDDRFFEATEMAMDGFLAFHNSKTDFQKSIGQARKA